MRRFAVQWPDVQLRPTEAAADLPLYDAVERGDVELSFVELPAPHGPYELFELMADPFMLVVRRDSPLARSESVLTELDVPLIGHTDCPAGSRPRRGSFQVRSDAETVAPLTITRDDAAALTLVGVPGNPNTALASMVPGRAYTIQ